MFHSRLIPPSPVLTLNYSCSSGVWPHKQRTRTIFEMLLPASGSHLNRSEANNAHQATQYLVRMQNTRVMLKFEKAAHTVAPLGLFLRGRNHWEPLPSVVLQVPANPWISDRSHCVSPVHVNCEKKSQKENWGKKQRVGHLQCCTVPPKGPKTGYLYHGPRCHKLHTWHNGIKQAVLNS